MERLMDARYPGKCHVCATRFAAGTSIYYDGGARLCRHSVQADCETALELGADAPAGTPAPPTVEVGELGRLIALFQRARSVGLRYPKIRLHAVDSGPIVLSLIGRRSSRAGWVAITDGGPYMANRFYGRVSPGGAWELPRAGVPADVCALVRALSANPIGVASAHGHASGSCCFCGHRLDDERSVAVGYGPICAGHFGLAWGETRETFITKAA